MATSTRATRSRFSSPLQLPTTNNSSGPGPSPLETSRSSANDATSKTFLQKWLEPSVQSKPSYEDHGLVRYGVTEGMVPLGEMPKSTPVVKKKEGQPVRRIILKKSTAHLQAAQAAAQAQATPAAPTPTPPATETEFDRRASSDAALGDAGSTAVDSDGVKADVAASVVPATKQESASAPDSVTPVSPSPQPLDQGAPAPAPAEKPMRRALPTNDSEDEHDHKSVNSRTLAQRNSLHRRSFNRGSTGRRASTSHQPATISTSTPVPAQATASTLTPTAASAPAPAPTTDSADVVPEQTVPDRERIERVIEHAVHEALDHCRYPTAWALRMLYDEKSSDTHFLALLESIYSQTADSSVVDEFAKLVEAKKREGNKDNRAYDHFEPPSPNPNNLSGHKRKRAPYAKLISIDLTKARHPSSPSPSPAPEPVPAAPSPVAEAPAPEPQTPVVETPSRRKHRSRKQHTASPYMMNPSGGDGSALVTPSRRRTRRDSAGSDSSALSELSGSPSLPSPTPAATRDRDVEEAAVPRANDKIFFNELRPSRQRNAKTAKKIVIDAPDPSALSSSGSPAPADATMTDVPSSPQFADAVPARRPVGRPAKGSKATRAAKAIAKAAAQVKTNEVSALDEANTARRREARLQSNFASVEPPEESSIRSGTQRQNSPSVNTTNAIDPPFWEELEAPVSTPVAGLPTRKTRKSVAGNASAPGTQANGRTTRSNKRVFDELEASSPTTRSFPPDVASNVNSSRAGTPVSTRAAKKQRTGTGLRVKSSPKKKTIGTAAGVPRQSGEGHPASSSNGGHFNSDDNDDYCSACGGVGELVCCEHCSRSFHFECVDLLVDEPLPDEWFCQRCIGTRFPTRSSDKRPGHFGALLTVLDKTNPGAFELPQHIQTYFENVRAGPQGDYEEENAVIPKVPKKRGGYEEAPDFHKVRDADGSPVLCHNCQQATASDRSIIPCSVCGLHWHLDCLDPPLAIPPVLRTWVCPAHNDDLLSKLPSSLAPAHKYRKIRDAAAITPVYSRGMKNNGFIEIINEEPENDSGWNDVSSFGRVYRLPENGIVLDFVSQVLRQKRDDPVPLSESQDALVESRPPVGKSSIMEHQAALNLAQLHESNSDGISQLTEALLDHADPAVLSLIARGDATNLASGNLEQRDQQSLQAMLAQCKAMEARINAALAASNPTTEEADALSAKNESAEVDLPTPATTAPDNLESTTGRSYQGEDSIMDVD
ncbi:hypothetical protein ACHAQH_001968 [Verticillium albo-atrum]